MTDQTMSNGTFNVSADDFADLLRKVAKISPKLPGSNEQRPSLIEQYEAERLADRKMGARWELSAIALAIFSLYVERKMLRCDYGADASALETVGTMVCETAELLERLIYQTGALNEVIMLLNQGEKKLTADT